jgi:hypothetical protein
MTEKVLILSIVSYKMQEIHTTEKYMTAYFTHNRKIHDCSLYWIGTYTSIKRGEVRIVLWPKHPLLVK